jgi:hypothetical protein
MSEKPKSIEEYKKWLSDVHKIEITGRDERYYEIVTTKIKIDFQKSALWQQLIKNLPEYNDEYLIKTGYPLLREIRSSPEILIKPFASFFLKTYRKNVLDNKKWPSEPPDGWIFPSNWYSRVNDTVRTLIEVKYLDGVEFIVTKIKLLCDEYDIQFRQFWEAREEGYYAAHLYITQDFEIPRINWDTERVNVSAEIQITTQLQEVIRKLLHNYYEDRRKISKGDVKWQWDYKSDEFAANYLGHILHYVEGMIMEIRDKQKEKSL